jgi:hypothetical protein
MTTLKPTLSVVKLKGSALSTVHFESIVNDVVNFVKTHFPTYTTLKDDLSFIEAILQIIISTIEQHSSPTSEKEILGEVFKRLFSLNDVDKKNLDKVIDYLIANKNVIKKGLLGKVFIGAKKEVSKVLSLFSGTLKSS